MPKKLTVATAWLQSCSGCHISLLDLHAELFDVLGLVELRYSPLMDTKEVPEVDLGLIEGACGNEEHEALLHQFREKSRIIVALGTCACFGGIPGLRNL